MLPVLSDETASNRSISVGSANDVEGVLRRKRTINLAL